MQTDAGNQSEEGRRAKLSYRAPQLLRLGTFQSFVLGGASPVGNDLALPEEDGGTS